VRTDRIDAGGCRPAAVGYRLSAAGKGKRSRRTRTAPKMATAAGGEETTCDGLFQPVLASRLNSNSRSWNDPEGSLVPGIPGS
jgi:hypothetical protein